MRFRRSKAGQQSRKKPVRRLAHREGPQEAPGELAVAAGEAGGVQQVRPVAAVLLALAAHAVHDRLLRRVDERVERGLEDALQLRLRAGEARGLRPGVAAAADADVAEDDRPRGLVHVHLQEAERLVVEGLEAVLALPADEARPAEAVRVEPGGAGGVVRLLRHQLDHGARRGLHGQEREAHHLLRQLERGEGPLPRRRLELPRALPRGRRRGLVHDLERAGDAVLEPVPRVAEPAHASRAREAAHGEERLAHERHLARAERRPGRVDAAVGQVVVVAPGRGRAVGRDLEDLGRRPRRVLREARLAPARGTQPRVEVLLQRPQVPALELPGPVGAVEEDPPGGVAHDLAHAPARVLDPQGEEEPRLPEGPGALAVAVEEDLGPDRVPARHQPPREIDRVGLVRARVARRRAPLHPAAVHEQAIPAVRRDPAARGRHLALDLDLAPEEDERVGQRPLAGQPDPAGGGEVDARPGVGRRPPALGHAHGGRLGLPDGRLRRRRGGGLRPRASSAPAASSGAASRSVPPRPAPRPTRPPTRRACSGSCVGSCHSEAPRPGRAPRNPRPADPSGPGRRGPSG